MFFASDIMAKRGVKAIFSNRIGGVSQGCFEGLNLGEDLGDSAQNIKQNLDKLCEVGGVNLPHQAKQVHGTNILYCSGVGRMHATEADILITTKPNVTLAVRTADCLPILLADVDAGVIAAVHAGWRGTVAKVAQIALDAMCKEGASPKRIVASFGPCIQPCCFQVNSDTAEQICQASAESAVVTMKAGVYADLPHANKFQLIQHGILAENIEVSRVCTSCHTQPEYFSYRRDCGKTGRQLSMISMREVAQ